MAKGFVKARLPRLKETLSRHVESGYVPGLVALVSRGRETHVVALGKTGFDGTPMKRDTIFRIASMTKPLAAVVAMTLVEEGKLRLDEPVDPFLPELANGRVLRAIDAEVDDTVPATRPVTLRDLLTFRAGHGAVMVFPARHPIQKAQIEQGLGPGPDPLAMNGDELMKRLGALPLLHQPGEAWLYHTGAEIMSVLLQRATGQSLAALMQERLFAPLGMKDTGFIVPKAKLARMATSYGGGSGGKLTVWDAAGEASRWSKPQPFESAGGGLCSTADDCNAFFRMMLNKGRHGTKQILSRATVELMTTNQIPPEQRAQQPWFFGTDRGWGFGMGVTIAREQLWGSPGRFGWDGGYGTSAYADPVEDVVGVLLTQRMMDSPIMPRTYNDFWTSAYQAIA
jgi:CubicO group peptidase (beta-lactamase class C family)